MPDFSPREYCAFQQPTLRAVTQRCLDKLNTQAVLLHLATAADTKWTMEPKTTDSDPKDATSTDGTARRKDTGQ